MGVINTAAVFLLAMCLSLAMCKPHDNSMRHKIQEATSNSHNPDENVHGYLSHLADNLEQDQQRDMQSSNDYHSKDSDSKSKTSPKPTTTPESTTPEPTTPEPTTPEPTTPEPTTTTPEQTTTTPEPSTTTKRRQESENEDRGDRCGNGRGNNGLNNGRGNSGNCNGNGNIGDGNGKKMSIKCD